MLFIVTLFAVITKTRFSGLKWSSATILFHTYRKFDVNLPKAPSFCKKNASFIENNLPFMGIMFLSRKEAKGSSFRCLAIPAGNYQFLLSPQCFLPVWRTFCDFRQNSNCRLQTLSFWKSLRFVVLEKVFKKKIFYGQPGFKM